MKCVFNFLFAYGQLGWKGRLSRSEHLYHQGRNTLAMFLMFVPAVVLFASYYVWIDGSTNISPILTEAFWVSAIVAMVVVAFTLIYLFYNLIRLIVLRLHDFNLSAWWILMYPVLSMVDSAVDLALPNFSMFVSLSSLAFLALLIMPGQSTDNRFGPTGTTVVKRPLFVKAVPLVIYFASLLSIILTAFIAPQMLMPRTDNEAVLELSEEELKSLIEQLQDPNIIPPVEDAQPASDVNDAVQAPSTETIQ